MPLRVRRGISGGLLACALALAGPMTANAALLWTLIATPLTATTGVERTFTLTATTLDVLSPIRCIVLDVPGNFAVESTSATTSGWTAALAGNRVTARSPGGIGGLLRPLSMSFTVRATPLSAGQLAWGANAYAAHSCGAPGSLMGVPPIVVVTGPAATPTPAPTAPPTPASTLPPTTPVPTPRPTPVPPLPSRPQPLPLPSFGPSRTPGQTVGPDEGSRTPSPTPGVAGSRSPTPSPSSDPVAPAAGGGGDGPPGGTLVGGRPPEPEVAFDLRDLDLGFGAVGLIGGIEIWAVPAATIGVPGLLVLLWALLQAAGALAWVPAARRLRGDGRPGRARRT